MDRDELVAATAAALAAKDALRVRAWVPVVLVNGEVWEGELLEDDSFVKRFRVRVCSQPDLLLRVGVDGRIMRGVPV